MFDHKGNLFKVTEWISDCLFKVEYMRSTIHGTHYLQLTIDLVLLEMIYQLDDDFLSIFLVNCFIDK